MLQSTRPGDLIVSVGLGEKTGKVVAELPARQSITSQTSQVVSSESRDSLGGSGEDLLVESGVFVDV